ncbi:hypothetical protein [Paenibacillus polymyxa]|uniref:hypothetical protein n=1 Tax=Paenibacillus polymyxa TaxID=1406 RepID=UPI002AB4843C|nr:hypothetical protein [Paenibacillus polymyxa]MDY8021233.1 hypothetical protein [Paenibacillus polymyxa]
MSISESNIHLEAKMKLYELIKSKKITIVDQFNNEHNILSASGIKDEFLNVEYPTVLKSKKSLGLNNYFPCLLKMRDDYKIESPTMMCNNSSFIGCNESVPCFECAKSNLTKHKIKYDRYRNHLDFFSFIPDIAYGYEGEHKIWIEIIHKHKCTSFKRNIAKLLRVKIIEVSSYDILYLENGKRHISGKLVTEMNNDEYNNFAKETINDNTRTERNGKRTEKRKNNTEKKPPSNRKKKLTRKAFQEFCNDIFKEEIVKMKNKIESNKGYYKKEKIDKYFIDKLIPIINIDFDLDFNKYIDYFYRSLGFSIITPSNYDENLLKQFDIDYFGDEKIIIHKETKIKMYELYKLI